MAPTGGVWAGPGGLAWFIDSPADLRRLAAFMRQHSEAASATHVAYKYLHRLKEVEGLLEQLPPQPAQGKCCQRMRLRLLTHNWLKARQCCQRQQEWQGWRRL